LGPWHGRATHPTPAGAGDTSRIVETEAGPAVYWRVGDDHFISVAGPATGRWGPDRLVATDAAAFNAVIAVCDGILVDLVDENDPAAFIHLHLARPGAETVSRTMGASDPEHFWNVTHRPSLTATGLEIGIRDAFESCSVILESEPLDAQTLASLEPRAWVRDPRTPKPPVPKTRLAGAQFDYAFHGLSDALGFEREGPALPPFAREIPLPAGGVGPSAWFGTALGPAGDVFVYDAGSPRDGHGRLLHLDTNGRRVTPDRLLSDVALRGVSLVSWPGGVALALFEDAGTTLITLDDPALVPDLEAPCMADALGRCGAGAFEADGEGWRCVPARPGDETCNAVDDDCDGLTDEAPAGCDFRWAGPAVSPRPPLSCPMDLIPWPEPLWATDPNPDPCAAFVNERPCRVGDASFHYDAAGHLLREPHRSFVWEEDRLTGWEGVTLAYDAAGRLEAVDDGDFDRTAFTYDASGRLVSWETGGRTLEYAWAPDGQSVTVRHMDFGSLPDFEVVATLVGGVISEVSGLLPYAGRVSPPGDPRCGARATFSADDSDFAAGDELRVHWRREAVMDGAGRLRASTAAASRFRDESDPFLDESWTATTWRFDALGRPSARVRCLAFDYTGSCASVGESPPGPTCAVDEIVYDCP
jgi:YD repeat-containing protein